MNLHWILLILSGSNFIFSQNLKTIKLILLMIKLYQLYLLLKFYLSIYLHLRQTIISLSSLYLIKQMSLTETLQFSYNNFFSLILICTYRYKSKTIYGHTFDLLFLFSYEWLYQWFNYSVIDILRYSLSLLKFLILCLNDFTISN